MTKQKKKLSPAQKAAKKKRQKEYMTIFVNGKQKRVKRPLTIDGMDVDEFIRRNADPIWLHQNEMWEYMDQAQDDDLFSFDENDAEEEINLARVVNMKIHMDYVSASEAGDYCQVLFEERDMEPEQDSLDRKYLLIQSQFEFPDGGRIYVESHDQTFIGHFKVAKAKLYPKRLCLTLSRKASTNIEVTFEASPKKYTEIKRLLSIMIPNMEIQNRE